MKSNFSILVFLFIVAFFAFFNVGGIFPESLNTTGTEGGSYVMVTPIPEASSQSLQLKFVQFKGCSSTTAVNFLVDRSGSMEYGQKLPLLKKGVLMFTNKLSDESIFGLQTYSQEGTRKGEWTNDINPDLFGNVKSKITNVVCSINAEGATYTKNAFEKTKAVLVDAQKKHPDRKFALIFVSDGVPETVESDRACIPGNCRANSCTCFAPEQDPTQIANEIKAMGIKIYTVAYVDKQDANLNSKLQALMKRVASSEKDYFMAPGETDVIEILNKISNQICTER